MQQHTPEKVKYLAEAILSCKLHYFLEMRPQSPNRHLNYERDVWLLMIREAVASLSNVPQDLQDDCWFSSRPTDHTGYSMIYPWKVSSNGKAWIRETSAVKMCRVFAVLNHPNLLLQLQTKDRGLQAAHRCHHETGMCWNPDHIVFVNDAVNKDMIGCRYGTAATCPHIPVCIWTDANGKRIPCRNRTAMQACNCTPCCYTVCGNQTQARSSPIKKWWCFFFSCTLGFSILLESIQLVSTLSPLIILFTWSNNYFAPAILRETSEGTSY